MVYEIFAAFWMISWSM